MQTDNVIDMKVRPTISKAGNECLRVDFITEYRSFPIWFTKKIAAPYNQFVKETSEGSIKPSTITYRKKGEFFTIYGYNKVADEIPS